MWSSSYRQPGNWATLKAHIMRRDNGRCYSPHPDICTGIAVTVDHIVNVATWAAEQRAGSAHQPNNLAAICQPCHDYKTKGEAAAGRNRGTRAHSQRMSEAHPNSGR